MIKVKDLRIGNIISYEGRELVVSGIRDLNDTVKNKIYFSELFPGMIDEEFGEPIPITIDKLIKFGFEKGQNTIYLGGFEIDIIDNEFIYSDLMYKVKLKYFHQLQNLYFSLTGEELSLLNSSNI